MNHTLRFVHITDTHINADPVFRPPYAPAGCTAPLRATRALIAALRALPFTPDFVLHTGDVASDPDPAHYAVAAEMLAQAPAPVYVLPGNHDDPTSIRRLIPAGVRFAATGGLDYEFECQGVQIVCVDSTGAAQDHAARLSAQQVAWLEHICRAATDRPLVVALHHPVLPVGVPWMDVRMRMINGEDLHAILRMAQPRLRGVFFGHIHQTADVLRDGILYSSAQSSWYQLHAYPHMERDTPDEIARPGFSVVTISAGQTFIRRHTVPVETPA